VRPDKPTGHGPLPNSKMYADCHNRLAKGYNLLTRARLDLPLSFSYVYTNYYGEQALPDGWHYMSEPGDCVEGGNWNGYRTGHSPFRSHT